MFIIHSTFLKTQHTCKSQTFPVTNITINLVYIDMLVYEPTLVQPTPQETDQDSSPEPKLDVFFDPIPSDGFEDYTTRCHSNENRDFKHQFTVSCCSSVYAGSSV